MPPGALSRERDVREAYAAHSGELYGFALRSLGDSGLAEEAVQETFLRAWRAGERFDPQIGVQEGHNTEQNWTEPGIPHW